MFDACRYADIEDLKYALDNHPNVNYKDRNLSTPIHMASANGHVLVIQALVSYTKSQNKSLLLNERNSGGNTPLHWAVLNNQLQVVKLLVSLGVDCNIKNLKGRNPCEMAVELQRTKIVDILAEHVKYEKS